MDLHVATEKVVSLKDAGLRYLVIVAGILTALALGQWTESRRHAQQGAQTLAEIQEELRRNEGSLSRALENQKRQIAQLTSAEELLGKETFAVPDLKDRARAVLKNQNLSLGDFNLVAVQRSAWDTAVASQSLQYVPKAQVVKFARFYAGALEVADAARQINISSTTFESLMAIDMFDRGETQDALRFARALREYRLTVAGLNSGYSLLRTTVQEALGDVPAAASAALPAALPSALPAALPAASGASIPTR